MKNVAVIGAGPGGLSAARHLADRPDDFTYTVFEQGTKVGGTWVLQDTTQDQHIHSSMYKGLRTNVPKELLAYPDYPFADSPVSFVTSETVRQYLESYTDDFNLRGNIKLGHRVDLVTPLPEDRWEIKVTKLEDRTTEVYTFDAVMVANGHHSTPNFPPVANRGEFPGREMHSHLYREPSPFVGQRVLVVGAGFSGLDITVDVATVATQVYLSHRSTGPVDIVFSKNITQVPEVVRLHSGGATFKDGTTVEVDTVIYCTGYKFDFPFLSAECGITTNGYGVEPLHKQLLHIERPTLCFLLLQSYIATFQLIDLQARFFLKVLDGSLELPSREKMYEEMRQDQDSRRAMGLGPHQAHKMAQLQGPYYDDLANTAKIQPLLPVVAKMHMDVIHLIHTNFLTFRRSRYTIVDDNNYIQY